MIDILGKKRILVLLVLAGINLMLGYLVYMTLSPDLDQRQADLQGAVNQVSSMRSDINRIQVEFDQLATQPDRFKKLKDSGFFNNQGRDQAEKILATLQKQAGVISAVANIKGGVLEDDPEAAKADHKILSSPINIHIDAVDSMDTLRYLYLLHKFFPGHLSIKDMTFERKAEINGTILRSISTGANPILVSADIDLIWETMIPKDAPPVAPTNAAPSPVVAPVSASPQPESSPPAPVARPPSVMSAGPAAGTPPPPGFVPLGGPPK